MKPQITHLFLILALLAAVNRAAAQGTAFTYQGQLNSSGSPASGNFDLTFTLYDAASGGTQQGGAITNSATAVSNGLFNVTLDFGNQFSGAARWLELGVRTNEFIAATRSVTALRGMFGKARKAVSIDEMNAAIARKGAAAK